MLLDSLIGAIADAKDTEPDELEVALENYVSTAAIRQLDAHERDSWTLQFDLPNHSVRIVGDGAILVDDTMERTFG
ncbi:HalOD1 output domain-containing protein [Halorubrum rubrum]|uniref:HalOD1 output domain-containing protein n=1 Tax=Halorubrum rubrum TaxID=1126240 RepID=A0ABD5R1D7_9EURY|nr:HalOD1 output domain-containing protein [Halorubrum rubrum]